jgi:hypothetical protein
MTGFTSIAHYSPALVLIVGGFTVAGIIGIGYALGRALHLRQPWLSTVGAIGAIEIFTLAVEAVSMLNVATRPVLIAIWSVFSASGSILLITAGPHPKRTSIGSVAAGGAAVILLVNLLIALCPSTKEDEVYYHMLVPSRIVQDSGLLFYREPLRAAIYPQMAFQIGSAPFHALAVVDGGNVVSWFFGVVLVWFAYRVVNARTGSSRWAGVWAAAIAAGIYTSVWHVTSGAHAVGDLAVTAAVLALYAIDDLLADAGTGRTALSIGILAAAAASSKVLLFPLAAAVILVAATRLGRIAQTPRERMRISLLLVLPGLAFMGPLMIWTAIHAGSPLGPLLEGVTGRSPYPPNEVRVFLNEYIADERGPLLTKLRNEAVNYSPLVWIGLLGFAFGGARVGVRAAIGIGLLLIQWIVILGWNTYDARYFGGVHYALMILFAMFLVPRTRERILGSRFWTTVTALLIAPWMMLQVFYAGQFLKLISGSESKVAFCSQHVAFFHDFFTFNGILPRDAVLLALPYGLDSIYAPRPIYYHPLDVPRGSALYLLSYRPSSDPDTPPPAVAGFTVAQRVYENDSAIVKTYRTPGKEPLRGTIRVWLLQPVGVTY